MSQPKSKLHELISLVQQLTPIYGTERRLTHLRDSSLKCVQHGEVLKIFNGMVLHEGEGGPPKTTIPKLNEGNYEVFADKAVNVIHNALQAGKCVYLRSFVLERNHMTVRIVTFSNAPEGFIHDVTKDEFHPEYKPEWQGEGGTL